MKFISNVNSNFRVAASILSNIDENAVAKVELLKEKCVVSLQNGLSFSMDVVKDTDTKKKKNVAKTVYVNAKYLGTTLESCLESDSIAVYEEKGKFRIGGFPNEDTNQFTVEAEFDCLQPFEERVFENEDARFTVSQTDIIEILGLFTLFDNVDICRKGGTLSYRASNGDVTVVTKFNLSNTDKETDSPDFTLNICEEAVKLMSFIGCGETTVSVDFENRAIKATDGNMTVLANYDDGKYGTISVSKGTPLFNAEKGVFTTVVKDLCDKLHDVKDKSFSVQYVDEKHIAVDFKRDGIGEISRLAQVNEAKKFDTIGLKTDVFSVVIDCSEESFITFCSVDGGGNVVLCENKNYLRKIMF